MATLNTVGREVTTNFELLGVAVARHLWGRTHSIQASRLQASYGLFSATSATRKYGIDKGLFGHTARVVPNEQLELGVIQAGYRMYGVVQTPFTHKVLVPETIVEGVTSPTFYWK